MRRSISIALALLLVAACGEEDVASLPVADAGFDQVVQIGQAVTLDGSASHDPQGAQLAYRWTLLAYPTNSAAELGAREQVVTGFVADTLGSYMFSLEVDNGSRTSLPDVVVVSARNAVPIAVAQCGVGSNCQVLHERSAALDGRASYDEDGDTLSHAWTQITDAADCASACPHMPSCAPSASPVTIADPTSAQTTFIAPAARGARLVFQLEVSDGRASGTTCLAYTTTNTAPQALLAGSTSNTNPSMVNEGQTFVLSGGSSGDADGDGLTYLWEQVSGPLTAQIASPTSASTAVTAPLVPEAPGVVPSVTLGFRLTVSDGIDSATVDISVQINNNG